MRSFIETHDIVSGETRIVLASPRLIEAPNWDPVNAALLVNGDGGLFRVSLERPELVPVETGIHDRLNNDHGVSPDGHLIAFCDKVETGQSTIYTMPTQGGAVRRVTRGAGPSWFHAWTPDGARIVYAAVRDGQFCIATSTVTGTDERIVITGPGHHDGPDCTPDGGWLWFNSDRGGAMQLWRVRPDGSQAEQMTDAARDAWFPHPSPDGRHVVYLAYPPRTDGHPRDCAVALRIIDMARGEDREIGKLFGGQGTINVPSWAPDGRRFAYVRYAPVSD